ncbi:MAG: class I SAM-dependent methyltransferase [Deltaproteobacteria bacterium]|nr:class I SAM-dependent methyltransferase [Deltaproteobacteria bacterium]
MKQPQAEKPNYGNWVSTRFIYGPGLVGLFFFGLAIRCPLFLLLAAFCFILSLYFAYARYIFSPQGQNIQDRVQGLVLSNLDWSGEGMILDIGCGSGALTIALAKKYAKARIIGIDNWGRQWGYSKEICEKNAMIEGVAERVTFQKASAAVIPFDDESMDVVVSNLVFHEVSGVKDKKDLIKEALRVVGKGGRFVFQDLFLWKRLYGEPFELIEAIREWGVKEVELINTSESAFLPVMLKLPFMVGTIGIIVGEK